MSASMVAASPRRWQLVLLLGCATLMLSQPAPALGQQSSEELDQLLYEQCRAGAEQESHGHDSSLGDHCIPLAQMPPRPRALVEVGAPFLGTGTLHPGFRIPGGAVWQPAFLAFGTVRTAAQGASFGAAERQLAEVPVRLDLFGNLYLTQTERVLIGLRPLDRGGQFTGLTLLDESTAEPGPGDPADDPSSTGFRSELNAVVSTLFFEGDFAELFPNLDFQDRRGLDFYFSVGRQPLDFQDGLLINEDILDMVGITRANMKFGKVVNTRVTGVYAWGHLNRHGTMGNVLADGGSLFGLFSEVDFRSTTVQVDAAFVTGDAVTGNGVYGAVGDTRRIGAFNSTFRVLASAPVGDETPFNSAGVLVHEQFSWTPHHNHNLWYIGAFAGIGRFRSAARAPSAGGPVGATGVLFAAPGIGRLGAVLGSNADHAIGGSVGHQLFFDDTRQQLVLELGARASTQADAIGGTRAGAAARYQAVMAQRFVLVAELGAGYDFDSALTDAIARVELVLKL